jgi:hypothetical protein
MKPKYEKIPRYADILAIPFWFLAFWYFVSIHESERTTTENILLMFTFLGLVLDVAFSFMFLG